MPRASFRDLFRHFYGTFESLRLDYFAYGGVASAVWGDPRETQDVDAVVTVSEQDAPSVVNGFQAAGFTCGPDQERAFSIDGWIRLDFGGRHADISLGRTPFDASALSRRRRMTLFGREVWVASAEDLVLYNLIAHRYKDLADVESVLLRQIGKLDLGYLRRWAEEIARRTSKFEVPGKLEELLRRADR